MNLGMFYKARIFSCKKTSIACLVVIYAKKPKQ